MIDRPEERIAHIMSNFDFEKVERVMVFTRWEWWNPKRNKHKVPTIPELKEEALRLLKAVAYGTAVSIACGGLVAWVEPSADPERLWLSFEVESAVAHTDC